MKTLFCIALALVFIAFLAGSLSHWAAHHRHHGSL